MIAAVMNIAELCKLDSAQLLPALRGAEGGLEGQRQLTHQVHAQKLLDWRLDPRYAQSMARHLVEDVHNGFRVAFADVLRRSTKEQVNVHQFRRVNSSLHHHHSIEDQWWFPRMMQRFPDLSGELKILEEDHKALVTLEDSICSGDFNALQEFIAALSDHLNREEMLTVPLLMISDAEF